MITDQYCPFRAAAVVIMESYSPINCLREWNLGRRQAIKSVLKSPSDRHCIAQNIKLIRIFDRERKDKIKQGIAT